MEKRRYFVKLSYNGGAYHGWQVQPNAKTIQETLENAFSLLLREKIDIVGAGRTDTGVHAKNYIAHFETSKPFDPANLTHKLNSFLPWDLVIHQIFHVRPDAHARFIATSRTYEYHLTLEKDPFLQDFAYKYYGKLDFEAMNQAAQILFEYSDFTSFSKLHTDVKTNNCKIFKAEWSFRENHWIFTIKADRFLRNMVRAVVGTLIDVGKGKLSMDGFRKVIETKNRNVAGTSVPPQGLYLIDIEYPNDIEVIED